jgi:F0F1-type ATP synthase assembly protein I
LIGLYCGRSALYSGGASVSRSFRVWEPFVFALELWLVVIAAASLSLYGGLLVDSLFSTSPLFATLGLGLAFAGSVCAGLYVVRRATRRPLLESSAADRLRQASSYALRLGGIIVGAGAVGVYGGWFLDRWLGTSPALSIVGIVAGYAASTLLAVRYTVSVLNRERARTSE